jgi:hypothetical protein
MLAAMRGASLPSEQTRPRVGRHDAKQIPRAHRRHLDGAHDGPYPPLPAALVRPRPLFRRFWSLSFESGLF